MSPSTSPVAPRPRQKPGSACQECRRRKLGCDRAQPRCSVCVDTGKECIVNAASARGPKRGHIKALQARIAALENSLSSKQVSNLEESSEKGVTPEANSDGASEDATQACAEPSDKLLHIPLWPDGGDEPNDTDPSACFSNLDLSFLPTTCTPGLDQTLMPTSMPVSESAMMPSLDLTFTALQDNSTHSSVGSTAYEDVQDYSDGISNLLHADRDQLYFDRVHGFIPILRQSDYRSWSQDPNKTEAQACLQQTMWALAISASAQYQSTGKFFYSSARRGLIQLETKNKSVQTIETSQVQACLLLSFYEFTRVDFHRGWMTAGHAFRLIQLLRWHEIDLVDTPATTTLPGWIEVESQRRAFWMAFALDRFMSMRHRTPLTISEQVITVRLPAPDSNFQAGKPILTQTLTDAITNNDPVTLDAFTELILISTICGRAVSHRQRSLVERNCSSSGSPQDFWSRHQWLCATLSVRSIALTNSDHFEPTMLFLRMGVQATLLYLHQLLENFVPLNDEHRTIVADSVIRSEAAILEIANLAKLVSSMGCYKIHPLVPLPLCLCLNYLMTFPGINDNAQDSLHAVLRALSVVNQVNILGQDSLACLTSSALNDAYGTTTVQPLLPPPEQEFQALWH